MRRETFQRGTITRKKRAKGPDVWVLRFKEGELYRSVRLGDAKQFPTRSLAQKEAETYRNGIAALSRSMNIAVAIDQHLKERNGRAYTIANTAVILRRFKDQYGDKTADWVKRNLSELESWINGLEKIKGGPLSKKTKQHVKAEIHTLFESIMRWGGMDIQRNPISLIRIKGEAKKTYVAAILTPEQYAKIREAVAPEISMMVMVCMCLGLRISETLGLKWEDVDFLKAKLYVRRSSVRNHQNATKTAYSEEELPLHPDLAEALREWKKATAPMNGWVFESPITGRPYHGGGLQRNHLKPAGKTIGIPRLGWHAFRHTYRHMLRQRGYPLEVQQLLMRHADIRTTTQYGGKKLDLREFNADVVEMVTRKKA